MESFILFFTFFFFIQQGDTVTKMQGVIDSERKWKNITEENKQ